MHPSIDSPPLPWRWRERALQWLDFPLGRFLDYGCGNCGLMLAVRERCEECHGVDVDENTLQTAARQYPTLRLRCIGRDGKTDYPSDYFDTVALVEVLEHVGDERATLAEVARVLKLGGHLLLTTPHKGLLTSLDIGNVKCLFPRLHGVVQRRLLGQCSYYQQRFEHGREIGLFGDLTVAPNRAPWHRHYKPEEVRAFTPPSLVLTQQAVYFPGMRLLMLLRVALRTCCAGKFKPFPPPLPALERRLSRMESPRGDQLVMLFEKRRLDG